MKSLILIVKGFLIGIANIIPGVSGGTIALIVGVYEKLVSSISHLFKNFKDNLKFLIPLLLGLFISMIAMSSVVDYSYINFPLATTLFFVGLVMGGIPYANKKTKEKKKISNWIVFFITFSIVIVMGLFSNLSPETSNVSLINMDSVGYIKLFFIGMIASATMVIPGISGSLVLMLIGYYYPVISLVKGLTSIQSITDNFLTLTVLGLGIILGIVLVSKLIELLFKKYENKTYYGVFGFIVASVFAIPLATFSKIPLIIKPLELIVGIVVLLIGYISAYKLGERN